jgi:hypothetical protein
MLSWYCFQIFFSHLVTIPVVPMIIGMTKHFMFHIRWISILKFLYFHLFSKPFHITFLSDGISKQILSFLFLIIMSGLFERTYQFVSLDSTVLLYLHVYMWEYQFSVVSKLVFNYYVGPICQNLPISLYYLIPQHCCIFMLTYRLRYVGVLVFYCFNA